MRHRIVYNNCYGGFSISSKAVEWLDENCKDNELRDFIKSLCLTHKADFVSGWFENKRHHKDLVAVVEALGDDANGPCASLAIEEISGNQYRISSYDGSEEVITPEDNYDWFLLAIN